MMRLTQKLKRYVEEDAGRAFLLGVFVGLLLSTKKQMNPKPSGLVPLGRLDK